LAFFFVVAVIQTIDLAHQPRYKPMAAISDANEITEWRGDRWTGMEEACTLGRGQSSGWHSVGWHPLDIFTR
jgi:hypothetical protein